MNKIAFKNKSFFRFEFMNDFLDILQVAKEEFSAKKDLNVDVLFVSASKMKKLNFVYRNKNYVTDILSFPLDSNEELEFLDQIELGQIIISP